MFLIQIVYLQTGSKFHTSASQTIYDGFNKFQNLFILFDNSKLLYYIVYMIFYEKSVQKSYQKGEIPKRIMILFHNAFLSLDLTKDLNLFDINKIKGNYSRGYFRLRKGKYRAIFYILNNDYYIIYIGKREEVYNKWQ